MGEERLSADKDDRSGWRTWILVALLRLIALLPLWAAHALGWLIGYLTARIPNKQRRNALINIRLCYPHLGDEEVLRFRNRSMIEAGKTYAEIAYLWQRSVDRVLSKVRHVSGLEHLERKDGRGVIVLSPHLGAWEMAGLYLSTLGPTTTLYKPQPFVDELIREARARGGADLVPTDQHGIRRLLQALKRGDYLGILPDQEPKADRGSVFAPFFGVQAFTMLLVNRLARKTGAKVVFLFAERLARGRGYALHCLQAPDGIDSVDDVEAATALNLGVEQCIAVCPDQYLWSYKRFRSRPSEEPHPYRGAL